MSDLLRERYETYCSFSEAWLWETDAQGLVTFTNPRVEEIAGVPETEVTGKPLLDLIAPDEVARVKAGLVAARQQSPFVTEMRLLHRSGKTVCVRMVAAPFFTDGGTAAGHRGIAYDVTPYLKTKAKLCVSADVIDELKRLTRFNEEIIAAVPSLIIVIDEKFRIESENRRFGEFFGVEEGDLAGKRFCEAVNCERNGSFCGLRQCFLANMQAIDRFAMEHCMKTTRGERFFKFNLLRMGQEKARFLLVVDDITQAKALEQQAMVADRMVAAGKMAAGIAHEINNPLQGISSHMEIIRGSLPQDFSEAESFRFIEDNIRRMRDIVRQLISIYHDKPTERAELSVNALVRTVISIVGNQARMKGVVLRLDLDDGDPCVCGWQNQLHQVLLNLIVNALEHTPKSGCVTVGTSRGDGTVSVTISDTGGGIDERELGSIFDPVRKTEAIGGAGVGLFVCQGLVKNHGGTIAVESSPGAGSTFILTLPSS